MLLNETLVRGQFPALERDVIFFDNPGGTQIARPAVERMTDYLYHHNANHGGAFATSIESDALLEEAHSAMADMLCASRPEEIVFGNNMTTLTLHISRSLARTWQPGDHIVVTRLDHDANYTPWILAAEDRGVNVIQVDFHPEDGTLDMAEMQRAMEVKPRLVAVGYASNALGTINPVKEITAMAHAAGALVYIDAVQYAPHGAIDVQDLDADFLVCSSYKFFGPHAGILYGKYELMNELRAYKVRPAPNSLPGKFETGTQNHEGIAGVLGTVEYLEWLGQTFGGSFARIYGERYIGRRLHLKQAMAVMHAAEMPVSQTLLDMLLKTPGVTVYGLTDAARMEERVPTYAFRLQGWHPRQVAEALAKKNIYVWDGNYYALSVTERLGLEDSGGMVRVGPVHYNTVDEVWKFGEALRRLVGVAS